MSIVVTLTRYYRGKGYLPLTGYNPHHFFDWRDAPFTVFLKGSELAGCPGLALQEVMFLEHLGRYLSPANCLVIGNAMGWSTVATALTFPGARTLGIDVKFRDGIDFTNTAFRELGLKGGAVQAESPHGVAAAVQAELGAPLDFVLIDADHTDETIQADFHAARAVASPGCVYLFHDVINWGMLGGFKALLKDSGLEGSVLTRTPSGMAIAHGPDLPQPCRDYIAVFTDDPAILQQYRNAVRGKVDPLAFFDRNLR